MSRHLHLDDGTNCRIGVHGGRILASVEEVDTVIDLLELVGIGGSLLLLGRARQ